MGILTSFARFFFKLRVKSINAFIQNPIKDQREILKSLLKKGSNTDYGKAFNFNRIQSYKEYSSVVPIVDYEDFFNKIKKILNGHDNIIWPDKIKFWYHCQRIRKKATF